MVVRVVVVVVVVKWGRKGGWRGEEEIGRRGIGNGKGGRGGRKGRTALMMEATRGCGSASGMKMETVDWALMRGRRATRVRERESIAAV